ncbi:MAG TPA: hypothetical protein PK087_01085 [Bacilli bacterium]|nr:MAG: hypothetical protein BWY97_00380 [Tenericutes bacterium ADurb.BinA124]HNZ50615.1 hypothetical protein [Bacilli bacterium]HOH17894.1 hypothetical protein [Bacilli bacterium]HPN60607.1 hypothetical protein [Bacilli bacterium]HPX83872.1 hypothetical protein [Bacilli bacterium]
MVEFSRYYINFIKDFFANIGTFFKTLFEAFADFFFKDIVRYFENLVNYSNKFNFLDWIATLVVLIINSALVFFLILRIYQFLRRYIRFVKREIEKDELMEEITALNQKAAELIDEKNKILAMKVSTLGIGTNKMSEDDLAFDDFTKKPAEQTTSRFVKLISVDEAYAQTVSTITMKSKDMIGLKELVQRFVHFSASQLKLYYDKKIIAAYFAGMATSKIIILEGISGTGKTSLPYAMGKFFSNDAAIVSVQPSWRDRAEMIGYLNEFTKKFNESDFLKSLYETTYREDLNFIILDEMNLARIEYYFAEFLSILEMPNINEWKIDVVPNNVPGDPKNLVNGKILVPQNVWFVGTANKDDSTFTITDKVYDRAIAIEMNEKAGYIDAPQTESVVMSYEYLDSLFKVAEAEHAMSPKMLDNLAKIDEFITAKFKITFGNRILKQIKQFVPVYVACGGTEIDGLDFMVARKIIRKFESLNLPFLQNEMDQLIVLIEKIFGKNSFGETINFINELKKNF